MCQILEVGRWRSANSCFILFGFHVPSILVYLPLFNGVWGVMKRDTLNVCVCFYVCAFQFQLDEMHNLALFDRWICFWRSLVPNHPPLLLCFWKPDLDDDYETVPKKDTHVGPCDYEHLARREKKEKISDRPNISSRTVRTYCVLIAAFLVKICLIHPLWAKKI